MIIKNAKAVMKNNVLNRDIRIADGIITEIADYIEPMGGEEIYDAEGAFLMPGFIDTHMHGGVMNSFYKAGVDNEKILVFEAENGVTAIAPSFAVMKIEDIKPVADELMSLSESLPLAAKVGGFHLEGPFLNFAKKGGMTPEWIMEPSVEIFDRLYEACSGKMKILTIAPELKDIEKVINAALAKGVKLSAGHTEATYEEMVRAIDAGVTRMTHTFNAMNGFSHRAPSAIGAALNDDRVTCEVICDFVHLSPAAVQLIYKMKGSKGFTAISDSEFCAGLGEGVVNFEGRIFTIKGGVAHLEDGTICGSAGTMYTGFCNLYSLGIPLWEIAEMMSVTPAKALDIYDKTGSIEIGKCADLVVIDDKTLEIKKVYIDGKSK